MSGPKLGACVLISLTAFSGQAIAAKGDKADAIPCGRAYISQQGDTLEGVSKRVYGRNESRLLRWANKDRLGDAGALTPGVELRIPCRGKKRRRTRVVELLADAAPRLTPIL